MIGYLMRSSAWDREGLTDVRPVCGPGEKISEEEVEAAIGKMKLGKGRGPLGCGGRYVEGWLATRYKVDD